MHVCSTENCPNTPRILFALEELGIDYEIEVVVFSATWGSPGPEVHDGDAIVVEPFPALPAYLARLRERPDFSRALARVPR
jgi:glutathione S-transferase